MNTPSDGNGDVDVETGVNATNNAPWQRLQQLRNEISAQSAAARKRQAGILVLMGAVGLVMMFGLGQVNELAGAHEPVLASDADPGGSLEHQHHGVKRGRVLAEFLPLVKRKQGHRSPLSFDDPVKPQIR